MNLKRLVENARQTLAETGLDHLPDGRTNQRLDERVVRFLRQAGVVSPPEGHGPGAVWGQLHHEQILACRALQRGGATLAEVAECVRGKDQKSLQSLRSDLLEKLQSPKFQEAAKKCPSWRIGEDFILVSPSGRSIPPIILNEIQHLLSTLPE
jgi:hypothetical protein